jgi:sortase A
MGYRTMLQQEIFNILAYTDQVEMWQRIAAIGICSACLVFATFVYQGKLQIESNEVAQAQELSSTPVEFSIQRLGLVAHIESVGISGDGAMAVPTKAQDVGWYELGTKPGDVGSAVLAGHVNWDDGRDAVFTRLHELVAGDLVQVKNSLGITKTFIVYNIKTYSVGDDTHEVFSSADDFRNLNLITCSGAWDTILKTHQSRLVVFTREI